MASTIRMIQTDYGLFKPTPELIAIFDAARIRRDGQPDRRTRAGKRWWPAFLAFSEQTKSVRLPAVAN